VSVVGWFFLGVIGLEILWGLVWVARYFEVLWEEAKRGDKR